MITLISNALHYLLKKLITILKSLLPSSWFWHFYAGEFYQDPWQHKIFPQHYWLATIITKLKPKTILEAGCGFGRNLKFLSQQGINPQQLTGIDFSPKLLKLAQQHLPPSIKLSQDNLTHLPFEASHFDLSFTHGVLMHLTPAQIQLALSELIRVTRHWLILIEETRNKPVKINHFTWAHDYPQLINQFKLKILDERHDRHHLVWYLLQKP